MRLKRSDVAIYVADTEAREQYQKKNDKLRKQINTLLLKKQKADDLKKQIKDEMLTYLLGWMPIKNLKSVTKQTIKKVNYLFTKSEKNLWLDMFQQISSETSKQVVYIYFHNLSYDVRNCIYFMHKLVSNEQVVYRNSFYSYSFEFLGKKWELRDSYKLYSQPLKALAGIYGLEKKTEDATYNLDFENKIVLEKMIYYFKWDIVILAKVMYEHYKKFSFARARKLSFSGIAESELKSTVKKIDRDFSLNYYEKIFKPIYTTEDYLYIKQAYFGGFVSVNFDVVNRLQKNIIVADVNSLYPSVMMNNMPDFSSKQPLKSENDDYPFKIFTLEITKLELKPGGFYVFPKKNGYNVSSSILSLRDLSSGFVTLTNLDLYHIKQNYNIEYNFVRGYGFQALLKPFVNFVEKHRQEKEEAVKNHDKARKLIAKLFLNSAYGKFAQNLITTENYIDDDLNVCERDKDTIELKYRNILIATFITAMARDVLFKAIKKVQENSKATLCYVDTDAVHFSYGNITDPNSDIEQIGLEYSENIFGKWKAENVADKAIYLGNKRYWERDINYGDIIKGAGITQEGKHYLSEKGIENFNFDDGSITVPSKVSKVVKKGVMIFESVKEIKPTEQVYKFL